MIHWPCAQEMIYTDYTRQEKREKENSPAFGLRRYMTWTRGIHF